MKVVFVVTMVSLAILASADVSHLVNYNYPAPVSNYAHQQAHTQSQTHSQIESIKPSVPVASFSVQQYNDEGASNYNGPVQQHYSAHLQQQSYSGPASAPHQQSYSNPATGSVQTNHLPVAQQQQYSSVTSVQQSSSTGSASAPFQQSYSGPATGPVQNTYLAPAPHQQYSSPTPVQQQSYSAPVPVPVVQQSYSIPAQQIYSAPAAVQQQSYSSVGQIQEQAFDITDHHQQSFGRVETTSSADNGAYNYQAPVQQQSLPAPATKPVQQSYSGPASAPVQQTYSVPSTIQQQSHSSSGPVQGGSFNYQPSVPEHQSYSATSAGQVQQSGLHNYQPAAPVIQQYSAPVQQTHSVHAVAPVQQAVPVSSGVVAGSHNYHPSAPVQAAAPVQQSYSAPISSQQNLEYSIPAPQKFTLPTPALGLAAPVPTHQIGTIYGKNGGYVYSKL